MKKYIVIISMFTLSLVLFSSSAITASLKALQLCTNSVIPSLFPFFVCSNLLIGVGIPQILSSIFSPLTTRLFGISGNGTLAIVLGCISGYPVGAKTACDLYTKNLCTKSEAEKLLAFCNNSGPMFVIGAIGSGMLGDANLGILLYISHLLSSLIVAFIIKKQTPSTLSVKKNTPKSPSSFGELLSDSIASSVVMILNVCGYVVIFAVLMSFIEISALISALSSLGVDYGLCKSVIYAFIECSGGCSEIISSAPANLKLLLLSSAISWSGLSVHLQVLGIIKKAKLSHKLYFKGKVLSAIISPLITLIIYGLKTGVLKTNILLLFTVSLFSATKIFLLIRQLFSRYRALPPR